MWRNFRLLVRQALAFFFLLSLAPFVLAQGVGGETAFVAPAPVRFLLTFDDGPSGMAQNNPTESVLNQLADNPIQSNIKAVFFLQTRFWKNGGSEAGQRLMQRIHAEGHMLAMHSGTARGHINHTLMSAEELEQSLFDGKSDIQAVTGAPPRFVRPPFWAFNRATLDAYGRSNLHMMMYDIRVNDGKAGGINYAWRLRLRVAAEMRRMHERIRDGVVNVVGDHIPLIVAFHDTNPYTARNLQVFMQLLLEEAQRLGLSVADKPFYDNTDELTSTALARSPGFLNWANATGLGRRYP